MKIEFTVKPQAADTYFLTEKINEEMPEFGTAYPFAFFIRDEQGQIIAGCDGSVVFGSIYTDQLWVHPNHRNTGLGRTLMEKVHAYGREVGCKLATVTTMSFRDTKAFYEKLGYTVDFEVQGYAKGSSRIFLRRSL